jgi:hypothetical protein
MSQVYHAWASFSPPLVSARRKALRQTGAAGRKKFAGSHDEPVGGTTKSCCEEVVPSWAVCTNSACLMARPSARERKKCAKACDY